MVKILFRKIPYILTSFGNQARVQDFLAFRELDETGIEREIFEKSKNIFN